MNGDTREDTACTDAIIFRDALGFPAGGGRSVFAGGTNGIFIIGAVFSAMLHNLTKKTRLRG